MSEPAHSSGRYGLGASTMSGHDTDEQEWPDEPPSPDAEEPLSVSEEHTAEFVRPLPEAEDRRGRPAASRPGGHLNGIWIGLAVVVAGFAAIFFSWSKVAGLTNVAEQVPYLVSSGLFGLALVIVGVAVVDVFVRRWDSGERKEQLAQMTEALSDVRELLEREPTAWPEGEEP